MDRVPEMKRFSLRLKDELHEKLRVESFHTGASMNEIIVEAIKQKYKGEVKMKRLLDDKYSNALELIEELGKIRMEDIDDGDLERLQEELQEAGYETYVDATTNYLIEGRA